MARLPGLLLFAACAAVPADDGLPRLDQSQQLGLLLLVGVHYFDESIYLVVGSLLIVVADIYDVALKH